MKNTERIAWAKMNRDYRRIFAEEIFKVVGKEKFTIALKTARDKAQSLHLSIFGETSLWEHFNVLLPREPHTGKKEGW